MLLLPGWSSREDGCISHVERLSDEEMEQLGITDEMLQEAIEKFGGAININRHYPISEAIREKLEESIEQEGGQ